MTMTHLKHTDNHAQSTLEAEFRLLDRLINSQERLADCNLFADAAKRDLSEAADDYRRALQATATMPAGSLRSQKAHVAALPAGHRVESAFGESSIVDSKCAVGDGILPRSQHAAR